MSLQGNWSSSRMDWGTWVSSQVVMVNTVFLLSSNGDLGVLLELQQGSQASSRVEFGNLAFLLSCHRRVASSRVAGSNLWFL